VSDDKPTFAEMKAVVDGYAALCDAARFVWESEAFATYPPKPWDALDDEEQAECRDAIREALFFLRPEGK
jgi:hypothetical protein